MLLLRQASHQFVMAKNRQESGFITASIKKIIEEKMDNGYRRFAIFPFGNVGIEAKVILNLAYGVTEEYIFDDHLCKYNSDISSIEMLGQLNRKDLVVIFATINEKLYSMLKKQLSIYLDEKQIADVYKEFNEMREIYNTPQKKYGTKCGKYSYGPLVDHVLVEEVGAFCSFAGGTDVVANHPTDYVTTHAMICHDKKISSIFRNYEDCEGQPWHFPGVHPDSQTRIKNLRKIHIGNDVWLGKNVLITNSANIGNGVIAGAGAIITKDVPDYAIVGGCPAKIIKFRYTPEEIEALNKISWWSWSDEEIRERYNDFYLPIKEFIKKYLKEGQ